MFYDIEDIKELDNDELINLYYKKENELKYDMENGDITSNTYMELQTICEELEKRNIKIEKEVK